MNDDQTILKPEESTVFQSQETINQEEATLFTLDANEWLNRQNQHSEMASTFWKTGDILENNYRIDGILGEGGMGKVYKAHHLNWNVDLAVKTIKPDKFSAQMLSVFKQEAETWINLAKHPHIATAFYVKEIMKTPAIFVEYIEGGSLNDILKTGKLTDAEDKLKIAIQFCEGIIYAHSKNLIHRDIKPDNVLIDAFGNVKITDFGLAKSLKSESSEHENSAGTPPYMPPEQWSNAAQAKIPADVYAFGVMLYEIFCKIRPFRLDEDDTRPPIMAYRIMHLTNKPVEPKTIIQNLPDELNVLILKCLEKEPEKRFQSFTEIKTILTKIYRSETGKNYISINFNPEKSKADDLNNRALSFLDLGQKNKALELWQQALTIEETHSASNINTAIFNRINGLATMQESLDLVNVAIENKPDDSEVYYFKALLNLELRNFRESLQSINKAIAKGFDNAKSQNIKGLCHLALRNYPEAQNSFRKAIATSPDNYGYVSNLMAVYEQSGNKDAVDECKQQIANIPTQVYIEENKKAPDLFWNAEILRTLEGHTNEVTSVAVCKNATKAVSGSYDNTLKLWDLQTGTCLNTFREHQESVYSVAINADGTIALSGSSDGTVKVWDLQTGKCMNTIKQSFPLISVALNAQGTIAIVGSGLQIKAFDLKTGACLKTLSGHNDLVHSVAVNDKGTLVVSGSQERSVKVWDVETEKCLRTIKVVGNEMLELVDINDAGTEIVFGNGENINHWKLNSKTLPETIKANTDGVKSLSLSADLTRVVSGSYDGNVNIWDLKAKKNLKVLTEHSATVNSVAFSENGKIVVSASADNTLNVWKIQNISDLRHDIYYNHKDFMLSKVSSVQEDISLKIKFERLVDHANRLFAEAKYLESYNAVTEAINISGFSENLTAIHLLDKLYKKAKLINLQKAYFDKRLDGHTWNAEFVGISKNGQIGVSYGSFSDNSLKIWDIQTGKLLKTIVLPNRLDAVKAMAINADATIAVTGAMESVRVWDLKKQTCLKVFPTQCLSATLSADGQRVVFTDTKHTLQLWDYNTTFKPKVIAQNVPATHSIAISSDNTKTLLATSGYSLKLYDLNTGNCIRTFTGHIDEITSVSFNYNDSLAVSSSIDNTIKLWNLQTGECLQTFAEHTDFVNSVAITTDGTKIVSGSKDKTLKIWDVNTATCLKTLAYHTQEICSVAVNANGTKVISGSKDRTVNVWELAWELDFETNEILAETVLKGNNSTIDFSAEKIEFHKLYEEGVAHFFNNKNKAKTAFLEALKNKQHVDNKLIFNTFHFLFLINQDEKNVEETKKCVAELQKIAQKEKLPAMLQKAKKANETLNNLLDKHENDLRNSNTLKTQHLENPVIAVQCPSCRTRLNVTLNKKTPKNKIIGSLIIQLILLVLSVILPVLLGLWWLFFSFTFGLYGFFGIFNTFVIALPNKATTKCPKCNKKFIFQRPD